MSFAGNSNTVRPKVKLPKADAVAQPTEPDHTVVTPVPVEKIEDGVIEQKVTATQRPERHGVVDTEFVPLDHLVVHTEGDGWKVNYYRQLLALGDYKRSLQQGTLPPTQTYEEVRNFILKVMSPLEPDQDEETKEFNVRGSGAIDIGINPNEGDMFVADIGDGRTGLFAITRTTRNMYNKLATYNIDYVLVAEYNNEWEKDLTSKISRTFYFEPKMVELYQNPFLSPADHASYVTMEELVYQLTDLFQSRFWSPQVHSLSVPNKQGKLIYDNYHAKYCRSIGLGDTTHDISLYQNGLLSPDRPETVWDLLYEMNNYMMSYVHKDFGVIDVVVFGEQPTARSILWSNYNSTMYPIGKLDGLDVYYEYTGTPLTPYEDEAVPASMDEEDKPVPYYWPIGTDELYVFSKAFYDKDYAGMSIIEKYTMDMLDSKPVAPSKVIELANVIKSSSPLDQFYYIPVLLTLMNYSQGGSD